MGLLMQLFPFLIKCCERWMDESRNWLSGRLAAVNFEVDCWDVCLESGEGRHHSGRFYEAGGASCASYYS